MNRIDFTIVITAEKCNPNADIGGHPRIDYNGHGEITDVCIKRKIRDVLFEQGEEIIVMRSERVTDGILSISERVKNYKELRKCDPYEKYDKFVELACKKWYDVRAFGQIFAPKGKNTSVGIRGPVSLGFATSLDTVCMIDIDITKSTNSDKNSRKKDSTTIGSKYLIDHGAYVCHGSILPQLAKRTGFDEQDAEKLKYAITHLFDYDASTWRPAGSMAVTLFWMPHSCENGVAPPIRVHKSLNIKKSDVFPYFTYAPEPIDGVGLEVYEGW